MAKRHLNRIGDLPSLFLRLEELALANSGQDSFEEIYKLILAKLLDEQCHPVPRFRLYATENETWRMLCALLQEAQQDWPDILEGPATFALTPAHLCVCVEALAPHCLSQTDFEVLDALFEFLVSRTAKGAKGQFFTPRYVVEFCVRMLQPTLSETVLDPACGSGGFLLHTLHAVRRNTPQATSQQLQEYGATRLWGFDFDPRATRIARTLMRLVGHPTTNLLTLNSLRQPGDGDMGPPNSLLTIEEVCQSRLPPLQGFDIILTNPPFAGEIREAGILQCYQLAQGRERMERDVLFLERCLQLLRPGGRMAIILPHNKLALEALGYVRTWLMQQARVLAVVGLGRNTFLPHTHQKTGILFLQKYAIGQRRDEDYPLFFAVSERDGKNTKGQIVYHRANASGSLWETADHDFAPLVEAFHQFCAQEALPIGRRDDGNLDNPHS